MLGWNDLQPIAAIVSAVCSIVAASVAVMVYRKSRVAELSAKIAQGDRIIKKHTDRAIGEVKLQLVDANQRLAEVEEGVTRIEESQKHFLMGKDLGPLHEKINRLAEQLATSNGTGTALREQLRVIHEMLMRGNRP